MLFKQGVPSRLGLVVGRVVPLVIFAVILSGPILPWHGAEAPPQLQDYDPEVWELIETTYLGHAEEFPDPGEPVVVLKKYLDRETHSLNDFTQDISQIPKFDQEIAEWELLVKAYPQSRHALVGLAQYLKLKAQLTHDVEWTRKAADLYIRAAEIALKHGRIRYTRELADLLTELGDQPSLDGIFGRILAHPKESDRGHYYLALVDYADALAQLDSDDAWTYFEKAVDFYPENNIEAINRYASYLLDRGEAGKAFTVLDTRLTRQQRIVYVRPAYLRRKAMELAGMSTISGNAEIDEIQQRLQEDAPFLGRRPLMCYQDFRTLT